MQAAPPFRRGNDAIARAAARAGVEEREIEFMCECPDDECLAPIPLTLNEYRRARSGSAALTAPGHEASTTSQ